MGKKCYTCLETTHTTNKCKTFRINECKYPATCDKKGCLNYHRSSQKREHCAKCDVTHLKTDTRHPVLKAREIREAKQLAHEREQAFRYEWRMASICYSCGKSGHYQSVCPTRWCPTCKTRSHSHEQCKVWCEHCHTNEHWTNACTSEASRWKTVCGARVAVSKT